ncbi:MAG: hypothetical protein KGI19_08880 [Thaumarchaeota archaeon]|nr:hypothetical protein [Nitrososphaerota archaeon]
MLYDIDIFGYVPGCGNELAGHVGAGLACRQETYKPALRSKIPDMEET